MVITRYGFKNCIGAFLEMSTADARRILPPHLEPIEDIESAVTSLLAKYGPDSRICVLPQGPQTIPYLKLVSS